MKVSSNILKNLSTSTLWFKQLYQIKLTRLERDLQSISWTSSSLIGVYPKFYRMSCIVIVLYSIIVSLKKYRWQIYIDI
jgi:hypothetical protein